jgi:glycosyltransferase involved in cell wall biosynthesis
VRIAVVSNTLPPEGTGGAEANAAAVSAELFKRHELLVLTGATRASVEGIPTVRLAHRPAPKPDDSVPSKAVWHARDQWAPAVHRATRRALASFRPDVVHTHEVQGLSAAVFTAVTAEALPHVNTAQDYNLFCVRVSLTRGAEPCGGRCAACRVQRAIRGGAIRRRLDALIAVSDRVREAHIEAGIVNPSRAFTVRNGAPPARARVRALEPPALRLGYIGALAEHKGILTLLAMMQIAPPEWRLSLAGGGPLEEVVRGAADGDSRISFAGRVGGQAKDAFYDALDLLIVPSEWEEPCPVVLAEAAVRGLPAVVSNRGGLPETPFATIFEARDADALHAAVRGLADSPGRLSELSSRLVGEREHFLLDRQVAEVERILELAAQAKRS